MTEPVRPRGPQRRTGDRRLGDERRGDEPVPSRALIPSGEPEVDARKQAPERAPSGGPETSYAAQLMGQEGAKKGLKGGAPVLNAARGAYLGAEYSGQNDRRPPPGKTRRTDI